MPIALWLRRDLRDFAWNYLNPDAIRVVALFEPAEVGRLWREHQQGRANHAKKLWALTVFQAWVLDHLPSAVSAAPDSGQMVRTGGEPS